MEQRSLIFQMPGGLPGLLTELAPAANGAVVAEASSGRSLHLSRCDQWGKNPIGLGSLPPESDSAHSQGSYVYLDGKRIKALPD
jgi:hypothetical protein